MSPTSFSEVAATAEKVVESIAKMEGPALTAIGMFVPGASPVTAVLRNVLPLILPDIERALTDIASGNNGDVFGTLVEFVNHIRAGMPNSSALSGGSPIHRGASSTVTGEPDASANTVG